MTEDTAHEVVMWTPLWILFATMVASGAFGGLINFFIADPVEGPSLSWWKHIIIGIGAALIIPVFLNSISANMIDEVIGSSKNSAGINKIPVLIGFCLIAAIISRQFITSFSKKLLDLIEKNKIAVEENKKDTKVAKEKAEQAKAEAGEAKKSAFFAQTAVAPFVEEDDDDNTSGQTFQVTNAHDLPEVTDKEINILNTMVNKKYSMRALKGMAEDSKLPAQEVNAILSSLIKNGFAEQTVSSNGQPRWYATVKGRHILQTRTSR